MANTRCHEVVLLDVRHLSPVTDYFVIASGTSARQMRSAADAAAELGEERDYKPMGRAGYEGESWLLIDFVDVVLHVFNDESRSFYDLDGLWGDAPRIQWEAKDEGASAKDESAQKPQ